MKNFKVLCLFQVILFVSTEGAPKGGRGGGRSRVGGRGGLSPFPHIHMLFSSCHCSCWNHNMLLLLRLQRWWRRYNQHVNDNKYGGSSSNRGGDYGEDFNAILKQF